MKEDKLKWDDIYSKNERIISNPSMLLNLALSFLDRSSFIKRPISSTLKSIKAVDIACGMGRNTKKLLKLKKGIKIDSIDISSIAIDSLKKQNINAICADLDTFSFSKKYDLVMKFYFLDRKILSNLSSILNTNGIFIFESLEHKEKRNHFLLEDEIFNYLKEFKILYLNKAQVLRGKESLDKISLIAQKTIKP